MNSKEVIDRVHKRIEASATFFFLRKSDGAPILCTGWYWLTNGKKKTKEVDWYDEKKPYYSNYMKKDLFLKRHEFIGEL